MAGHGLAVAGAPAVRAGAALMLASVRAVWRIRHALAQAGVFAPGFWRVCGWLLLAALCEGLSLYTLLALAVRRDAGALALIDDEGELDYASLQAQTLALASAFHVRGIGRGTKVALLARNHRGFVLGLLAASRVGADVLLLNSRADAPQLAGWLRQFSPDLLLLDEVQCPLLPPGYAGRVLVADRALAHPVPGLAHWLATPPRALGWRWPGGLTLLTSGSTGAARGIRRKPDLAQVAGVVQALLQQLGLACGQRTLVSVPLFHGYGLASLALALALSAPCIISRHTRGAALAGLLRRQRPDVLVTVPTLLERLLAEPDWPAPARVLSGSAPLPAALASAALARLGPCLFNLYGSSETGMLALATPADLQANPACVGRPISGVTLRLFDRAGQPVAAGESGEVTVSSDLLFDGYLGQAGRGCGAWRTGDLGRFDAAGRLMLLGRLDDLLIIGGENIVPQEVEDRLRALPGVRDVAVGLLPGTHDRLACWLVGAAPALAELNAALPGHWRLAACFAVTTLPRNAIGKLQRRQLPLLMD
ncbi:AMP-binding protein [Chitinilyticum piscinae]|uniref:AMP-binding protein n=1 Tax=Chitinilyticum piscinae TaxID=2866724 RepID=UPI00187F1FD0|nr:AMP-binding protein [Chitinilyticum piscinae]